MAVQRDPTTSHDPTVHRASPAVDELLVARHVAGDVDPAERALAMRLVAHCRACAVLAADLRSIAAATRKLPAPRRPRDFQLSGAEAARLRRPTLATSWRRALASLAELLAGPGFAFSRPLATGLVTLGVVGLLLTSLPSITFPGAGSTAYPAASAAGDQRAPQEAAASAASSAPPSSGSDVLGPPSRAAPAIGPTAPVGPETPTPASEAAASPATGGIPGGGSGTDQYRSQGGQKTVDGSPATGTPGPSLPPVPVLSFAAILAGGVIVLLRWAAGRTSAG